MRRKKVFRNSLKTSPQLARTVREVKKRRHAVHTQPEYVSVALKVLNSVPKCCARDTSELSPFATVDVKRWANRAEEVQKHSITISLTQIVVPYSGNAIFFSRKIFHTFIQNRY